MASHANGNSGESRQSPYSQAQIDEMRAYNACLTKAGQKKPSGRAPARASPAPNDRLQIAPGQTTVSTQPPTSTRKHAPGVTKSGITAGWGMMGRYSIGLSTRAPMFKATKSPPKRMGLSQFGGDPSVKGPVMNPSTAPTCSRSPTRHSILVQEAPAQDMMSRYGGNTGVDGYTRSNTSAGQSHVMFPHSAAGPSAGNLEGDITTPVAHSQQMFARATSPWTGCLTASNNAPAVQIQAQTMFSQATDPWASSHSAIGHTPTSRAQATFHQTADTFFGFQASGGSILKSELKVPRPSASPEGRPPSNPGRQQMVANMKPIDPSKPLIPAHLQQISAREALEDRARMAGKALDEAFPDGGTIGSRPRAASRSTAISSPCPDPAQAAAAAAAFRTSYYQPSVDSNPWSAALQKSAAQSATLPTASRVPSCEMDVDPVDGHPADPTEDLARVVAEMPRLAESRWAKPSSKNVPSFNGAVGGFTRENVESIYRRQTSNNAVTSAFNKNAPSEANSFGTVTHPIAPAKHVQNSFESNEFIGASRAVVTQTTQNPVASNDSNAFSVSRNIAADLAGGGSWAWGGVAANRPAQRPARNKYNASPFGGQAVARAPAASSQSNPIAPDPAAGSNLFFCAPDDSSVTKPIVATRYADPVTGGKALYLAESYWA
ncbi:hypothetical protein PZA11_007166 [Diplocarpon coronariae]